ncbi:MAG: CvpA family protein [Anaerolineae bacterium]|nr:CvpA family protein [Anaerolineae bacterium]
MTSLDYVLIVVGILVIALSATQGVVRVFIMCVAFYLVCIIAGMATLASGIIQNLAAGITEQLGGSAPPLAMAQVIVFVGLGFTLYIGSYFISRAAYADTSIPELGGFDNVLGAVMGILLAIVVMAVLCNTWGIAANAPRLRGSNFWLQMKAAHTYSTLRPMLMQALGFYKQALFMFNYLEYPIFFIPR